MTDTLWQYKATLAAVLDKDHPNNHVMKLWHKTTSAVMDKVSIEW